MAAAAKEMRERGAPRSSADDDHVHLVALNCAL
jgi:hypothetical protein